MAVSGNLRIALVSALSGHVSRAKRTFILNGNPAGNHRYSSAFSFRLS